MHWIDPRMESETFPKHLPIRLLRLSASTRGIAWELLRVCASERGYVCESIDPSDVAVHIHAHESDAPIIASALESLLAVGFLTFDGEGLYITSHLHEWHRSRVSRRWSREHYAAVYERDHFECRYCGSIRKLSIDHVVPRSQGGSDDEDNLVVACRSCNSRKGARTPEEAGMVLR